MAKAHKSFRLEDDVVSIIQVQAEKAGLAQSAILEEIVRQWADFQKASSEARCAEAASADSAALRQLVERLSTQQEEILAIAQSLKGGEPSDAAAASDDAKPGKGEQKPKAKKAKAGKASKKDKSEKAESEKADEAPKSDPVERVDGGKPADKASKVSDEGEPQPATKKGKKSKGGTKADKKAKKNKKSC